MVGNKATSSGGAIVKKRRLVAGEWPLLHNSHQVVPPHRQVTYPSLLKVLSAFHPTTEVSGSMALSKCHVWIIPPKQEMQHLLRQKVGKKGSNAAQQPHTKNLRRCGEQCWIWLKVLGEVKWQKSRWSLLTTPRWMLQFISQLSSSVVPQLSLMLIGGFQVLRNSWAQATSPKQKKRNVFFGGCPKPLEKICL